MTRVSRSLRRQLDNYAWGRPLANAWRRHSVFAEGIEALIVAVILALVMKAFVAEAFTIPSASMHDTLLEGDRIFVNKLAYVLGPVEVGDIIVFKTRGMPALEEPGKDYYIKRVVGLPGDVIAIRDGWIYRNDERLESPDVFLNNLYVSHDGRRRVFDVPPGEVFVFGDNSFNSFDSRAWGGVPLENIIGEAVFRYYPWGRFGAIDGVPPRAALNRRASDEKSGHESAIHAM